MNDTSKSTGSKKESSCAGRNLTGNHHVTLAWVIYMAFPKKLIDLRKARQWTQQDLAKNLGMGLSQIKRYELGQSQPTLSALKKIATTFRISVDELVFDRGVVGVAARRLDGQLLELFEEISRLPQEQREAVKFVLDSVVANARLVELAKKQQGKHTKGEVA